MVIRSITVANFRYLHQENSSKISAQWVYHGVNAILDTPNQTELN